MKTRELAICALLLTVMLVLEYLDSLFNFRQVFTLAICGVITYYIFNVFGYRTGFVFYLAGSAALFLIIPRLQIGIQYLSFFGAYSAIRHFLEMIRPKWLQVCLKLAVMDALATIMLVVIRSIAIGNVFPYQENGTLVLIVGCLAFQVVFFIYDNALAFTLQFLRKRVT